MALGKDPLRLMIHEGVYVVLFLVTATVAGWALTGLLNSYLVSNVATFLFSAVVANWLALRIYANRRLIDAGLWLNRAAGENLLAGLAGGAGAACLVLGPPLLLGVARLTATPGDRPSAGAVVFVMF